MRALFHRALEALGVIKISSAGIIFTKTLLQANLPVGRIVLSQTNPHETMRSTEDLPNDK